MVSLIEIIKYLNIGMVCIGHHEDYHPPHHHSSDHHCPSSPPVHHEPHHAPSHHYRPICGHRLRHHGCGHCNAWKWH
ncbi:hypothetical protein ABEB36_009009 [Hypothenemus hampei]|uniref:Uncharacterized protein n=1 Tax=Hypothenemus hampei TaxID=57062 RepID=A0ABD1ENT0_HYPHA